MAGDKINITYEVLFEVLKNEKNRNELQKLTPGFFEEALRYLSEKQSTLTGNDKLGMFSEDEKQKTAIQVNNIKKILKEIYERRERKIIQMALNRSRTKGNIMDISALQSEEKPLFEDMSALLSNYREAMLSGIFDKVHTRKPQEEAKTPVQASLPEVSQEDETDEDEEKEVATKMVRFIHPVPKFMGKDLEVYGPFDEEDVASLPVDVADVLIKKGRAEELSGD